MSGDNHSLYSLYVFTRIVENGGLTAAARELDLSQPAISAQLKKLELQYGRLLDRGRAGIRLTERGRTVLKSAQRISQELQDLRETGGGDAELDGEVRLAACTFAAAYRLPAQIAAFHEMHPRTEVALLVSSSLRAQRAVTSGEVGLGIVGEFPDPQFFAAAALESVGVAHDTLALYAHPKVAEKLAKREWPAGLENVDLLWRERGSSGRAFAEAWLQPWLDRFARRREVGSSEAIREFVLAGLGVGILSEHAVAREAQLGLLTAVPAPRFPYRRQLFLTRLRRRTPSRLEAVLWEHLSRTIDAN